MKPWYLKKKIWATLLAGLAVAVSFLSSNPELGAAITALGSALLLALGLEDQGKAVGSKIMSELSTLFEKSISGNRLDISGKKPSDSQ